MMQILESGGDDYDEPRFSNGSMSCLFPMLTSNDGPRRSLAYDKLDQQPLRLTVLKLDGSSFGIEVAKSGTVGDLKKAVESVFRHLPKKGPGKVSWEHVWGQFCLCHEGQKLLTDSDCISLFAIKDGDQLQFVHHTSNAYNLVRVQSEREQHDSDDEPSVSGGHKDGELKREKDDGRHIEILKDNRDDNGWSDDDDVSRCEHRLANLFTCWFPYRKLPSSHTTVKDGSSSSSPRSPHNSMLGSSKNCLQPTSNRHESWRETWKGK